MNIFLKISCDNKGRACLQLVAKTAHSGIELILDSFLRKAQLLRDFPSRKILGEMKQEYLAAFFMQGINIGGEQTEQFFLSY